MGYIRCVCTMYYVSIFHRESRVENYIFCMILASTSTTWDQCWGPTMDTAWPSLKPCNEIDEANSNIDGGTVTTFGGAVVDKRTFTIDS